MKPKSFIMVFKSKFRHFYAFIDRLIKILCLNCFMPLNPGVLNLGFLKIRWIVRPRFEKKCDNFSFSLQFP